MYHSDTANNQLCAWTLVCTGDGAMPELTFDTFAIEAGWVMSDYQGRRRALRREVDALLNTITQWQPPDTRVEEDQKVYDQDPALGERVSSTERVRLQVWALMSEASDRPSTIGNRRWADLARRSAKVPASG